MDDTNYNRCLGQFIWSLQAIAEPAKVQLALFPPGVCKADELALDFDHWRRWFAANAAGDFTEVQQAGIEELDKHLAAMSAGDPENWTDRALQEKQ